jgi:hypothetical protein
MTIAKPNEPWMQTAETAAQRRHGTMDSGRPGRAARSELALRNAMEDMMRQRMPDARMCHEMVMGGGTVRADLVAVGPAHIAAIEVKGAYDDTSRLLHQIGMYQLCVPEVWMVVDDKHRDDANLIRHLLPSVGLITADGVTHLNHDWNGAERPVTVEIVAEPDPRPPVPVMALEMLWANELRSACAVLRVTCGPKATRAAMIRAILDVVPMPEIQMAICRELRGRDAQWRADAPIRGAA